MNLEVEMIGLGLDSIGFALVYVEVGKRGKH